MKIKLFLVLLAVVLVKSTTAGIAHNHHKYMLKPDASFEPPFAPVILSSSIRIDKDDTPPIEPKFTNVTYRKSTPFNSLEDRINRLTHGVIETLPPEYDHYGHEIRKYMAQLGNNKIFDDEEFLKEQIKSVRKARVVFEYWESHINEEIREIDEIVQTQKVTSLVRTNFKQNKAHLKTFFLVMKSWINTNERLLMFIFENFDYVEILYPEIVFKDQRVKVGLYNILAFKQQKLKELKEYKSFEMMVY